jgi:Ca2+-binding EF-hand superfamily protein
MKEGEIFMGSFNGGSLISGISNGLLNTYSQIASTTDSKGVSAKTVSKAMSNKDLASALNPTFAGYLQSNFANLDKNHDGILTPDEIQNSANMINAMGLTSAQLTQLGTASGLSQESLSQVLAHFSDIDKNHDGRVTAAEINSYNAESSKMKLQDEFRLKSASNMSMFYGSESSDSDVKSLMAYKYLD